LIYAGTAQSGIEGPFDSDPYGVPLQARGRVPYLYRGRLWHADLELYRIGARWYDPRLRRFLTLDIHTGAPDDARLVNPFRNGRDQRMARAQILGDWLRQPRLRNRHAYCANDPVNRFDPDGHWSFGGVLLSLLGVLWTLPNTAFGLAVEVSCLLGEVVRWLVWLFTLGHVSWQTPGFDVAASGRLNAFALVFKGGWLGSFESLLGITFGNVIFVNGEYQNHPAWRALPDPVAPPAYNGAVTVPKSQALYEHELRHVNQYGWWGPFFHLGLPLFGVYEWDVILNGYQNASFEKDARDHGGF
jgi:RHS repeat-associated protein